MQLLHKLRTSLFLILLAIGAGVLLVLANALMQPTTPSVISPVSYVKQDGELTYLVDRRSGLQLVVFPPKELRYYLFSKPQLSLRDIATTDRLTLIINAGYFSGDIKNATHAGYLYNKGKLLSGVVVKTDKQITHLAVQYNDNTISFIPNAEYQLTLNTKLAFQAGPLILDQGTVMQELINRSINGNSFTTRSFLGKTTDGRYFLGVSRSAVQLAQLATMILSFPNAVGEKPSVINLDGGSSTAMYVPNNSDFGFSPDWINPTAIGF